MTADITYTDGSVEHISNVSFVTTSGNYVLIKTLSPVHAYFISPTLVKYVKQNY